jgi:hypothetical protein
MNPSDPNPERLERVKEILSDSYPRTAKGEEREGLPDRVLVELGNRNPGADKARAGGGSFREKLRALLSGPQMVGLGAAAVLIVSAVLVLRPPDDGGGQVMRSGGGDVSGPPQVVLYRLSAGQLESLRESPYFRSGQLLEVPPGGDLQWVLDQQRDSPLVLVDGETGEISAPLWAAGEVYSFVPGTSDLQDLILEFLESLPEQP